MPRVPRVTGPEVADSPLQGGMQRTNASPQMLHNSQLGEVGKVLAEAGADIQQRTDADVLMRAETDIKAGYLQWSGEAKNRRGQNAWGVAKDAGGWWDKESQRIGETMTPLQRQVFDREVAKMRGASMGDFAAFEAGQRRESLDASAQASIVGSINLAAANPRNQEILATTKSDVIKRNKMRAFQNGWDDAMTSAKEAEYLTNFHKQVIQGLVRDDPAAAEAYFNTNKAEIEGAQHAEIGGFAQRATATRLGDTTAEGIWQKMGPKSDTDPVTLDTMEQAARKELADKPEAMKSALAGIKERASAFKDARRERTDQLEGAVNKMIMDGASTRQVRSSSAFLALPPEQARKIADFMETRELRKDQRAAAQSARAASEEVRAQAKINRETMGAYLTYSNPEVLNGMTETQVLNLLPVLGNEHTQKLMEQKRRLQNPTALAEARMDQDDFNQVAQEMGLHPFKAKSEDEKAALGAVKYRVEQMINSAQQGGKKALGRDEKLNLMRQEMARTVTVDTWGWNNAQVPVIALTPDQIKSVVIPAGERRKIAEAMQELARENPNDPKFQPTEDNLRRWYLKGRSPAAAKMLPQPTDGR